MKGRSGKSLTKKLIWVCVIEVVILFVVIILWQNSVDKYIEEKVQNNGETLPGITTEYQGEAIHETVNETEVAETEPSMPTVDIDMNCDHIFEVFNGKDGIETSCRFCGISQMDLYNAGITLPDEPCDCEYETVLQMNGTPAYECKKCHNIKIKPSAALTELKLISDTNAKGKNDDIKYCTF